MSDSTHEVFDIHRGHGNKDTILPPEISDEIIDMVGYPAIIGCNDDERRKNLRACSLVCRGWVYRSRKNLFHYIRLYGVEGWDTIKQTLGLLPSHAKDVRMLYIASDKLLKSFKPNQFLAEVSSLMPAITTLTFSSIKLKLLTDDSSELPFRLNSVQSLTFDDVKLHTMKKFDALIQAFPSVTSLILDQIYLSKKHEQAVLPNFEEGLHRVLIKLRQIEVYHDRLWSPPTQVHQWIARSPVAASVTRISQYGPPFQYSTGDHQTVSLSELLRIKGPLLVYLRLPAYVFRTKPKAKIFSSLQLCTSLQDFSVGGVDGYHLADVVETLQSLRCMNIKKLSFGLLWRRGLESNFQDLWDKFDEILCSTTFKNVEIVFVYFEHYLEHAVDIGKYLPRVLDRGILKVKGSGDVMVTLL